MQLRTAERRQARMRLALQGVSGAGKTFSSLIIARGMTDNWSKVALIDMENEINSQIPTKPFHPPAGLTSRKALAAYASISSSSIIVFEARMSWKISRADWYASSKDGFLGRPSSRSK